MQDFDSAKLENEEINTWVDVTTDVAGKEERLVMSSYQSQISKDPLQDSQTELPKHSHCLPSTQQHVSDTGSVSRAVGDISYNERPKRYLLTSNICVKVMFVSTVARYNYVSITF